MIVSSNTPSKLITTAGMPGIKIETREVALKSEPGDAAQISTDADNRLKLGSDGKLYVADTLTPDPLDSYLLARGTI